MHVVMAARGAGKKFAEAELQRRKIMQDFWENRLADGEKHGTRKLLLADKFDVTPDVMTAAVHSFMAEQGKSREQLMGGFVPLEKMTDDVHGVHQFIEQFARDYAKAIDESAKVRPTAMIHGDRVTLGMCDVADFEMTASEIACKVSEQRKMVRAELKAMGVNQNRTQDVIQILNDGRIVFGVRANVDATEWLEYEFAKKGSTDATNDRK